MRRTRHVVLPVRSWAHVGLMIVSLACLTLGLVSRDREGQSGSLAGPDLQHGAPHKVDACPNGNVFTRLPPYDDPATPSGQIPIKPEEDHPTESRDESLMGNREVRLKRDNRDARSVRRSSADRISQSGNGRSAERRDLRVSERRDERRSRSTRDTRALERVSSDFKSNRASIERSTDRRREQRNVERNSRLVSDLRANERREIRRNNLQVRDRRLSERDSDFRNIRMSMERRENRMDRHARQSISFERDTENRNARVTAERRDNRIDRRARETSSIERNPSSRYSGLRVDRSVERRDARFMDHRKQQVAFRSLKRNSGSRNSELTIERSTERRDSKLSERRDDRTSRSLVRNVRLTTERDSERREDRRNRQQLSASRNSQLPIERSTERRDSRLSERRADDRLGSSVIRNVRLTAERKSLVAERRDERGSRKRDSVSRSMKVTTERLNEVRDARISGEREDRFSRSIVRNIGSVERRVSSATDRQDDRRSRLQRDSMISTRNIATDRSIERRDDRRSREFRSDVRDNTARNSRLNTDRRRVRHTRSLERAASVTQRRSLERDIATERRGNRLTVSRQVRDDRNSASRNSHRIAEHGDDRQLSIERRASYLERNSRNKNLERQGSDSTNRRHRDVRSIQRDATDLVTDRRGNRMIRQNNIIRSFDRELETRNGLTKSRSVARSSVQAQSNRSLRVSERASVLRSSFIEREQDWVSSLRKNRDSTERRGPVAENRVDRSSRVIRETTKRRENRVAKTETGNNQMDIRSRSRSRNVKVAVAFRREENRNRETRVKSALQDTRFGTFNIPKQQLPSSATYEGIRQTAILILCTLYAASLLGGKGSLSRNITTYANRFVVW